MSSALSQFNYQALNLFHGPICQHFNCWISSYCIWKVHGLYDMQFRYKEFKFTTYFAPFISSILTLFSTPGGCNWHRIELGLFARGSGNCVNGPPSPAPLCPNIQQYSPSCNWLGWQKNSSKEESPKKGVQQCKEGATCNSCKTQRVLWLKAMLRQNNFYVKRARPLNTEHWPSLVAPTTVWLEIMNRWSLGWLVG